MWNAKTFLRKMGGKRANYLGSWARVEIVWSGKRRGGVRMGFPAWAACVCEQKVWELSFCWAEAQRGFPQHTVQPHLLGETNFPQREVNMRHCPVLGIQSFRHRLITFWLRGITGVVYSSVWFEFVSLSLYPDCDSSLYTMLFTWGWWYLIFYCCHLFSYSLQTTAVQPNTVQTHITSFQVLMEIPKFPKMPNIYTWWNDAAIKITVLHILLHSCLY